MIIRVCSSDEKWDSPIWLPSVRTFLRNVVFRNVSVHVWNLSGKYLGHFQEACGNVMIHLRALFYFVKNGSEKQ